MSNKFLCIRITVLAALVFLILSQCTWIYKIYGSYKNNGTEWPNHELKRIVRREKFAESTRYYMLPDEFSTYHLMEDITCMPGYKLTKDQTLLGSTDKKTVHYMNTS